MNVSFLALIIIVLSVIITSLLLLCEIWDILDNKKIYFNTQTKITNIIVDFVCIFLVLFLEIYLIVIA